MHAPSPLFRLRRVARHAPDRNPGRHGGTGRAAGRRLASLQALLLHQRAEATRFSLQAALATARSQAIMRRELIGLCASADGQRCGDDWSQGWIAYRAAGAWQPPSTADAIVLHQGGRPDVTISTASSSGRPQLYFQPDGRSPGSNLTLQICVRGREHARVIVSNSGRARSSTTRTGQAC